MVSIDCMGCGQETLDRKLAEKPREGVELAGVPACSEKPPKEAKQGSSKHMLIMTNTLDTGGVGGSFWYPLTVWVVGKRP